MTLRVGTGTNEHLRNRSFLVFTFYKGLVGNRHISINRLMVTFACVVDSEIDVVDLSQRMLIWWEVVHE